MTGPAARVLGGRYRLVALLGAGGMGEVWRGVDDNLGRRDGRRYQTGPLVSSPKPEHYTCTATGARNYDADGGTVELTRLSSDPGPEPTG